MPKRKAAGPLPQRHPRSSRRTTTPSLPPTTGTSPSSTSRTGTGGDTAARGDAAVLTHPDAKMAAMDVPALHDAARHPAVDVRTSTRRRKTATAFWQDGRVVVVLPAWMPHADRPAMIESLARRAEALATRYLHGTVPGSIRWVGNQQKRWGSCSPHSREIRISDRLRAVPAWVLDAVLVHELAHLEEPSHSSRFYTLANRYPRMDDAAVFLEGFGLGL